MDYLFRFSLAGCRLGIGLATWPGVALDLLLLGILLPVLFAPLLFGLFLAGVIVAQRADRLPRSHNTRWFFASLAAVTLTVVAISAGTPRYVAFALCRPAFESYVEDIPAPGRYPLDRWVGVFHVDEYAVSRDGGVFFRVRASGAGWIGRETTSFGFAYRPGTDHNPFGRAYSATRHLVGDWYQFMASDDL